MTCAKLAELMETYSIKEAALIEDGDISAEQHKNVVFFAFDSANLTAEARLLLINQLLLLRLAMLRRSL